MRMKGIVWATVLVSVGAIVVAGQGQPPDPNRTPGVQGRRDPGRAAFVAARCKNPAPGPAAAGAGSGPRTAREYTINHIPGVVAAGERWHLVWEDKGNNGDGIVGMDDGSVLVGRNDKSDVVRVDKNGQASVVYTDTYAGGALAANAKGQLFVAERSLDAAVWLLEPERRLFANKYNGEPLECFNSSVLNDVAADNEGGVYMTLGGLVFYANAQGLVSKYDMLDGNGIIVSPDEKTLYVGGRVNARTEGGGLVAFDIQRDGVLTNARQLTNYGLDAHVDGLAVDTAGRIYGSIAGGIMVSSPEGKLLGMIPTPRPLGSLAFGGPDKKTLYVAWNSDVQLMSLRMIAQGYKGRPK